MPPNACGNYDGDGLIGTAEDVDAPDRIFGTINGALRPGAPGPAAGTGANQNGSVTIVTSGIFPEIVVITAANGNVTLQAAPGVEANIDAMLQGDATPPGNAGRQDATGVIVNTPADRRVTIRNVMSRNWTVGYDILGDSFVTLDGARAENNTNYGVRVRDRARVAIGLLLDRHGQLPGRHLEHRLAERDRLTRHRLRQQPGCRQERRRDERLRGQASEPGR